MTRILTIVAAGGSGLIAGAFFAFSTFVMKALATLPAAQGVRAMQAINLAAPHGLFVATLVGTAAAGAGVAVLSLLSWSQPGAALRLAGGIVYVAGTLLVTGVANVPRNDALAALEPDSAAAADLWTRYLAEWTAWNHVRTAAALAAAALLVAALIRGR
jgi:uncharacterized membrane protein